MNIDPVDDLDITAKLPQLEWNDEEGDDAVLSLDSDTAHLRCIQPLPLNATSSSGRSSKREVRNPIEPGEPTHKEDWRVTDELLSVRDKIVDLEASLLDAELKLAKLEKQHQELHTQHSELQARAAELTGDRDRIDADRALLVESHQQLKDLFERHQVDTDTQALANQAELQIQQQKNIALQAQLDNQHAHAQAEILRHQESAQAHLAELTREQTEMRSLTAALETSLQAREQQEMAAAALARNLARELLEKQSLHATLEQRDLHISALQRTQRELSEQLSAAQELQQVSLGQIDQLQTTLEAQARQVAELQAALATNEKHAARLNEQLETEHGRVRSGEQDQERLTRLAAAEHASYESARQELAGRVMEINTLQDQVAQARTESVTLQTRLAERDAMLHSRNELLTAKQQTLQLATDSQAAATIREAALSESLALLQENLRQTQAALAERTQATQNAEEQLATRKLAAQQLQDQLHSLQAQLLQAQKQQHERDDFILDQATELDRARNLAEDLGAQLAREQAAHTAQRDRVTALQTEQAPLHTELALQVQRLAQTRQELAAKQQEQGVSAKQVETLQQELRQNVAALNAIRHDIHQVAQQSRFRDSEVLVRTLIRVDDESVVHLLNKPVMVIGRGSDAEICIHADSISRRHACLRVGRDVVIVEDLGSTNGCYVNGKRVKRQLLKDGDRLDIGAVQFRFATRATQN